MSGWRHVLDTRNGKVRWAFPVTKGMKPKDMPADARPAIEQRADNLPDVVFRDGAFQSVRWKPAPGWPEPEYTSINAGDWLAQVDWGLKVIPSESVVQITSDIQLKEQA